MFLPIVINVLEDSLNSVFSPCSVCHKMPRTLLFSADFTILFLRLLLSFTFDGRDISNARDCVSSHLLTPRILSKLLSFASYVFNSSRCMEIGWKHCTSCLLYWMKFQSTNKACLNTFGETRTVFSSSNSV